VGVGPHSTDPKIGNLGRDRWHFHCRGGGCHKCLRGVLGQKRRRRRGLKVVAGGRSTVGFDRSGAVKMVSVKMVQ